LSVGVFATRIVKNQRFPTPFGERMGDKPGAWLLTACETHTALPDDSGQAHAAQFEANGSKLLRGDFIKAIVSFLTITPRI
jgi:hypothetical protein